MFGKNVFILLMICWRLFCRLLSWFDFFKINKDKILNIIKNIIVSNGVIDNIIIIEIVVISKFFVKFKIKFCVKFLIFFIFLDILVIIVFIELFWIKLIVDEEIKFLK